MVREKNTMKGKAKLIIDNVSRTFVDEKGNAIEAIKDVSVEVMDKEFVAIVGPSGCGKSTLLRIVSGLIESTKGQSLLDGKIISKPNRDIGLVFQYPASFAWLTVLENVEFGLKLQKIEEEKRKNLAKYLIDLVGLSGFESSYIKNLSGGMKQRVAIATVLANNPDILLMDEPFSALDAQTRGLMQELVLTIWQEAKKTVLFVTHDIEEAIFLADRVYIMSAKPGEIKDIIKISLPRPRFPEIKLSEEFLNIKKHISYLIRGEAIKAAQIKLEAIRPKALKIGIHTWPGNVPFYLAEEVGLYKKYDLEVELLSQEKEEDRLKALENKEVDLLNLTTDGAIIAKDKGLDLQIILCLNKSKGGDAILARREVIKIEDLRGKRIAVEKSWVGHFFLLYILDKYGIKNEDVQITYMRGSDIGAALIAEKVDAAVLWEPWLTQAKKLSGANVLISTKEDSVIFDVLTTTKDVIKRNPEQIGKLIKAWFDSLKYINQNRDRANKLMAIPLGVSTKELTDQLQGLEFLDIQQNVALLGIDNKQGTMPSLLKTISEIWLKNKAIKNKIDESPIIDNSFLG